MSDATKRALDEAVAARFADECEGSIVEAWHLEIAGRTLEDYDDGRTQYYSEIGPQMSVHVTLGLLDYALARIRHNITEE